MLLRQPLFYRIILLQLEYYILQSKILSTLYPLRTIRVLLFTFSLRVYSGR